MSNLIKADYVQEGNTYTLDPAKMTPRKPRIKTNDTNNQDEQQAADKYQAAELEIQQMLEEARTQAEAILAESRQQAEEIQNQSQAQAEEMRQKAEQDGYQTGNAKGYEDGYEAGFTAGEEKAYQDNHAAAIALQQALEDYEKQWQTLLAENIDDLKFLALEIAEKIVEQQINMDEDFYIRMVDKALDSFRNYQWVDIYMDKQPALAVRLEEHLADVMTANSAYLRIHQEKDALPGYLVVESDVGVVDASVQTQLEQVEVLLTEGGAETV